MLSLETVQSIQSQVQYWKLQKASIAFVPTMGNLHAGHLALVERAKQLADKVVVSIYVNPLQFGENEDFDSYPRTLDSDKRALIDAGADALFLPNNKMMYPESAKNSSRVHVPNISGMLCGEYRPGHFTGVATIVCKLFNIIQADVAVFGEKDFQQVAVIRKMVKDLFLPIKIETLATVRENDGLAMSSRNQYLTQDQREIASKLYEAMMTMVKEAKGNRKYREIELNGAENLEKTGHKPEYVRFCDSVTLLPAITTTVDPVLLIATWLGETRLIDNMRVH